MNEEGLPIWEPFSFCLVYIYDMKFTFTSLLLCLLTFSGMGQATDTLGYSEFYAGNPVLYYSPNGGYAFGNNGYGDKAKAQTYQDSVPFVLRKVLLDFGAVSYNSSDPNSVVRVVVYDNTGFGVTEFGSDSIAPWGVISFVDIPVSTIQVGGSLTEASFENDTIVIYEGQFSVGIDLTQLSAGDTVGLLSTTDGDLDGEVVDTWELTSGNTWFSVSEPTYSWNLEVDLAIFPVIDEDDPAGLVNYHDFKFTVYPNPATDFVTVSGPFRSGSTLNIYDSSGKLIRCQSIRSENLRLDVRDVVPGVYSLVVTSNEYVSSLRWVKL